MPSGLSGRQDAIGPDQDNIAHLAGWRAARRQPGGQAGGIVRRAGHSDWRGPGLVRRGAARRRADRPAARHSSLVGGLCVARAVARGAVGRRRTRRLQRGSHGAATAADRCAVAPAASRAGAASHPAHRRDDLDRGGPHRGAGRPHSPAGCRPPHWRSSVRLLVALAALPADPLGGTRAGAVRACWSRSRWPPPASARRRRRAASSWRWRGCRPASSTGCGVSPPSCCTARRRPRRVRSPRRPMNCGGAPCACCASPSCPRPRSILRRRWPSSCWRCATARRCWPAA